LPNFGSGNGEPSDLTEARTAVEIRRARKLDLEHEIATGALVDREAAEAAVFTFSRQLRDGFLAWVARSAPIVAAELGSTEQAAARVLDRLVREFLIESGNAFSLDHIRNAAADAGDDAPRAGARSRDDGQQVGGPAPGAQQRRQRRARKVAD